MIVVTLARKPLTGSVASNVQQWGAGGLDIDRCRVKVTDRDYARNCSGDRGHAETRTSGREGATNLHTGGGSASGYGRWPANLILEHRPECRMVGTRTELGYTINRWNDGAKPFGGGAGHPYTGSETPPTKVAVWACVNGCPVKALDDQSGFSQSRGVVTRGASTNRCLSGGILKRQENMPAPSDAGGASRFFKVIGGKR